jgi:uncharacterized protein (DUF934 family)
MKTILRNGQPAVDDDWRYVTDDETLPAGDIIVSLTRWRAEQAQLLQRTGRLGVCLQPEEAAEDVAEDLAHFATIAIIFPVFKDGRGLTTARLLRERYHYAGDIRATGDVLIDQLFFMQRVGINVLELREDQVLEDALAALRAFTTRYQPAVDEPLPLYRRRQIQTVS